MKNRETTIFRPGTRRLLRDAAIGSLFGVLSAWTAFGAGPTELLPGRAAALELARPASVEHLKLHREFAGALSELARIIPEGVPADTPTVLDLGLLHVERSSDRR